MSLINSLNIPGIKLTEIDALMKQGANIDQQDDKGNTVLIRAIMKGVSPSIIQFLLDKGADVNQGDNLGTTPLMHAIQVRAPIKTIQTLLDYGADINAKDKDGRSILSMNMSPVISNTLFQAAAKNPAPSPNVPTDVILTMARELWPHHGPICDMRGFTQHRSECWNDTFQTLLVNSDLTKSVIQDLLINGDIGPSFYSIKKEEIGFIADSAFISVFYSDAHTAAYARSLITGKGTITNNRVANLNKIMGGYVKYFQRRFLRHYVNTIRTTEEPYCTRGRDSYYCAHYGKLLSTKYETIKNIDTEVEACVIKSLERNDVNNGSMVALISTVFLYILNRYTTDRSEYIYTASFNDLDKFIKFYKNKPNIFQKEHCYYAAFKNGMDGHAVGFYSCGGKPYFINDNLKRVIEFSYKEFINNFVLLSEEQKVDIILLASPTEDDTFSELNKEVFAQLVTIKYPLIMIPIDIDIQFKDIHTGISYIVKYDDDDMMFLNKNTYYCNNFYILYTNPVTGGGRQNTFRQIRRGRKTVKRPYGETSKDGRKSRKAGRKH